MSTDSEKNLQYIANLTEQQLEKAKEIYLKSYKGSDNPIILAAIIQAMAINFQTHMLMD
ncbi:hypothetical protein GM658_05870 [Pseudoduganella eburnea]|uniref:Uncharacterized protein n=1 Tax=Massilia eburnea TaxID=1776165 RepID=A0A6L6QDK7_9BURK|nr:hypothetical protein [Massilia eburnea]MTW10079.1 hypothetical protein [Massilia eburnea]MTW10124.1 hypothetical protein [Massilia eburnea]